MKEIRLAMSENQVSWLNENIDAIIERQALRSVEPGNKAAEVDGKMVTILYMLKCGARLI